MGASLCVLENMTKLSSWKTTIYRHWVHSVLSCFRPLYIIFKVNMDVVWLICWIQNIIDHIGESLTWDTSLNSLSFYNWIFHFICIVCKQDVMRIALAFQKCLQPCIYPTKYFPAFHPFTHPPNYPSTHTSIHESPHPLIYPLTYPLIHLSLPSFPFPYQPFWYRFLLPSTINLYVSVYVLITCNCSPWVQHLSFQIHQIHQINYL